MEFWYAIYLHLPLRKKNLRNSAGHGIDHSYLGVVDMAGKKIFFNFLGN